MREHTIEAMFRKNREGRDDADQQAQRRRLLAAILVTLGATTLPAMALDTGSGAPAVPPPALELLVLGSGGPGAVGRAGASFVVLVDGQARLLVDAGAGAFVRAGEEHLSLRNLDIVLLTHLHIDHASELPGLFKARAVSQRGPVQFRVFGPGASRDGTYPSTTRFMDLLFGKHGAFAYLRDFSAPLSYRVSDVKAPDGRPHVLLEQDGLSVTAIAGHHREAPAVIYRVDYRGRSITFSGDIDPQAWPSLAAIAKGSDLLVVNSVVLDPPGSPPQLYELHTPPRDIGRLARDAGVGQLLLAHLNPAIDSAHDAVLASIRASYSGPVLFSEDRMRVQTEVRPVP